MPIKNLSETRRLPRLGKLRLGLKKKKSKPDNRCKHDKDDMCFYCSYPVEVEYFVAPPEVQRVYGPKPTELDCYLPIDEIDKVFPQRLAWYSAGGRLRCAGDGEQALRIFKDVPPAKKAEYKENGQLPDDLELVDFPCPCPLLETGDCARNATLNVILPKVSLGGVYQVTTGSINSIIEINSDIDFIRQLFRTPDHPHGRAAMIPLILRRVEQMITYQDKPGRPHWILKLEFRGDAEDRNRIMEASNKLMPPVPFQLPPPEKPEPGETFDRPEVEGETIGDRHAEPHTPPAGMPRRESPAAPEAKDEEIPESVSAIIAELKVAAPATLDDVFKKHLNVINSISARWQRMIIQARDIRRRENPDRQVAIEQREKLLKEINLFTTIEDCNNLEKNKQAISALSVEDQLIVSRHLALRKKELSEAPEMGKLFK